MTDTDAVRRFVTAREAAERYGIHEKTLRAAVGDGSVPAMRVGKVLRFDVEALDRHFAVEPTRSASGALTAHRTQRRRRSTPSG